MKKEFREYHPNGGAKHIICYDDNGGRDYEQFYDEDGIFHRENLPDYQEWYENGMLNQKTYCIHGKLHNIYNPADICLLSNGKINEKYYHLKERFLFYEKLTWINKIKNI